jgi:hypothetical protein
MLIIAVFVDEVMLLFLSGRLAEDAARLNYFFP